MTDQANDDTDSKPTVRKPKPAAPTACPVCDRRLNDGGRCQHCGYQHR